MTCLNCSIKIKEKRKFCSRECYKKYIRYKPVGPLPPIYFGENHPMWKGEDAKYNAKHAWVKSNYGTKSKCQKCGSTSEKKYEWANISGKFKRSIDDWIRLCVTCHHKMDRPHLNYYIKKTNKSGYRGVSWHTKAQRWMSQIQYDKQYFYLGLYDNKEKAALAYNVKFSEIYPDLIPPNKVT